MSYIDGNLVAGERVIYRTRLHWLLYLPSALVIVLLLLPCAWWLAAGSHGGYAWIPLGAGALILLAQSIKRRSSDFAVTNMRVMTKVGVFHTRSVELLLNKIEAIAVEQTLLGRLLGYGNIIITGSGGTHEAFAHIQAPLAFRNAVQAVTRVSNADANAVPPQSPSAQ